MADEPMHNMDCGIAGGMPHPASAHDDEHFRYYRADTILHGTNGSLATHHDSECIICEVTLYRAALETISREDYRGPRPRSIEVALDALDQAKGLRP